MTIDAALHYAKTQAIIHKSVAESAVSSVDKAFHEAHAEALETLYDEVIRLQHELLVAVAMQ